MRDHAPMTTINRTHADDPHYVERGGWLRAAVLGANDGIVSVSSLLVGVAAATPGRSAIIIAGLAALVAGAMSMAAGEYVSVSSQADMEGADIERERAALAADPVGELAELTAIYEARGLAPATARLVAEELTAHDGLGAHVRDEIGLSDVHAARPLQAAAASGLTFSVAAAVPLAAAIISPYSWIVPTVLVVTVLALFVLGALGARAGGARPGRAALRVVVWGVIAMAVTAAIGRLVGVAV